MDLKTILGFLSKPQLWTGAAVVLITLGIAGPAAGFISANAGQLAALFGLIFQRAGFGTEFVTSAKLARIETRFGAYTDSIELGLLKQGLKIELGLLKQGLKADQVDEIMADIE